MNPLFRLRDLGQSPWLDYIRRGLITSGGLKRLVDEYAVSGVTSNPTILNRAISGSTDYDDALRSLVESGERDPKAIFLDLAVEDIGMTADVLRAYHDETGGADGFASLEVSPDLARDTEGSIKEAMSLFSELSRPNVMIKVPGTPEGLPAITQLISQGVNVNVTLLFDVKAYERVALAYIDGLERRLEAGEAIGHVSSVASFFDGTEGAFIICTFWLADNLIALGELKRARDLLEKLRGCANDLGLFSEEIDPETGV